MERTNKATLLQKILPEAQRSEVNPESWTVNK